MLSVKHEPRGSLLVQTVHDALARMAHLKSKSPLKNQWNHQFVRIDRKLSHMEEGSRRRLNERQTRTNKKST